MQRKVTALVFCAFENPNPDVTETLVASEGEVERLFIKSRPITVLSAV